MPDKTKKQRKMFAIAEHHPEKLFKKNKGVLKMSQGQLHDFAATKEKKLPKKKKPMSTAAYIAKRRKEKYGI
jgi:hypothetical protein